MGLGEGIKQCDKVHANRVSICIHFSSYLHIHSLWTHLGGISGRRGHGGVLSRRRGAVVTVAMKKTKTKNVNNERLRPRKQMEHSLLLHVTLIQKSPFAFAWTETWPSKALFGGADRHGLLVLVGESVSSFGPRDYCAPRLPPHGLLCRWLYILMRPHYPRHNDTEPLRKSAAARQGFGTQQKKARADLVLINHHHQHHHVLASTGAQGLGLDSAPGLSPCPSPASAWSA